MNLDKWEYNLCSEHSLMTTFVCFNNVRDRFITCGEDGQINVYENNKKGGIFKLSHARIFQQQVIICIKWANVNAGGKVALSGSKGSLVILSINEMNGQILIQTRLEELDKYSNSILDMDWHPSKKILVCSTSKKIKTFQQIGSTWSGKIILQTSQSTIRVCWGTQENSFLFYSLNDTLYFQKVISDPKGSLPVKLKQLNGQIIQQISCRNQLNAQNRTQLIILTKNKLKIWNFQQNKQQKNQQIQLCQQIDLQKSNFSNFFWGWSQNQIICYPRSKIQYKKDKKQKFQNVPTTFKRRVSGIWQKA